MAVLMSAGKLANVRASWYPNNSYGSLRLYDRYNYDYATLYKRQPNIRTCVEFLARNIAQLGLHVFRRVSDTDRQRLIEHDFARVLSMPLPRRYKVTRYRLIESLVADMGIYFNAYWLKVKHDDLPLGILRVPPQFVSVKGGLLPTGYVVTVGGNRVPVKADDIVHFRGYNPESAISGLSPLETLRRVLAEEHAAGQYRENYWQNAARMHGIIERPAKAPEWSRAARSRFKDEFEALYSGVESSGKTAILEDGMQWKEVEFSAAESEYLKGRELTREECARAYHIPLPMVGILEHATFSNIKSQHEQLYQDSLGPWLKMIEEEVQLQLLPDFGDTENVYVEFNIQEKLKGSFEEQSKALQSSVGRPWMTANEARARQNLPQIEDPSADQLVTPLNVLVGGQASPQDVDPTKSIQPPQTKQRVDVSNDDLRKNYEQKWREALRRHYGRVKKVVIHQMGGKEKKVILDGDWYDVERWERELREDLLPLNIMTSRAYAKRVLEALEVEIDVDDVVDGMRKYLEEHSRVQASYMTDYMTQELEAALQEAEQQDAVEDLFSAAMTIWIFRQATTAVTGASNFGANEGAKSAGMTRKTWRVNSKNPRPSHAAQNGTTVNFGELFPSGHRWPGDSRMSAEDNAGCMCTLIYS